MACSKASKSRKGESDCGSCGKKVEDEGVQCERCDGWTHVECANLDSKEYKLLKKTKSNLRWFCDSCNEKYLNSENKMNEVILKNEKLELKMKS